MNPAPADPEAIASALARHGAGATYKATLEQLLLTLAPDAANAVMLLLKESRGAWALLLTGEPGRALFLGNALSGSVTALAKLGWRVTVGDPDADRVAFAAVRDDELTPGRVEHVCLGLDPRLPFQDDAFDLVVQEGGAPSLATGWGHAATELARVGRGERVLVADNRLAYKRSTGRRGEFHVPGPFEWARAVLRPERGERTLRGYRQLLGEGTRAFAVYPHAHEFSHVVGLDAPTPRLTVGPQERTNRAKMIAQRLGLFPLLTPSYALLAGGAGSTRLERMLDELAGRIGERPGPLENLVATRSNTGVILLGEPDAPGGWALHLPFSPNKEVLTRTHARFLGHEVPRFPGVPYPELLFEGEVDGVYLTVERRLGGVSAPQITGDLVATRRLFLEVSRILASLTLGPPEPMTDAEFDQLVGARAELAASVAAVEGTSAALLAQAEALRCALVGRPIPRVLYHADLRAKHLQISAAGDVLGLLDWGAAEEVFLPYVDLLHLLVHQRKQEAQTLQAPAWRALRDGEWREHERAVFEDHTERLGLDAEVLQAMLAAYPLLAAGMAERNWDYSRPRWVHTQYGL